MDKPVLPRHASNLPGDAVRVDPDPAPASGTRDPASAERTATPRRRPAKPSGAPERARRGAVPPPAGLSRPPSPATRMPAGESTLDMLSIDELARVLTATAPGDDASASRGAVGGTGALAPIGGLVADAGLSFPDSSAYLLEEALSRLTSAHRRLVLAELTDRLGLVGPGNVRILKFDALVTACDQLDSADKGPALIRLARSLHGLPEDAATHGRVYQFIALLGRSAELPPADRCALRVALADQAPAFLQLQGRRLVAIGALAAAGATMPPADEAPLLCSLVAATVGIADAADSALMFETLFQRCARMPATPDKARVLAQFARHIDVGDPDVMTFVDRLLVEAARLPAAEHARVLTQVLRMVGALRPEQLGAALDLLAASALIVPQNMLAEFHATVHAMVTPMGEPTMENLVADAGIRWIMRDRNDIATRVARLPEGQRHEALAALVARLDDTLPPAIRMHKMISLYLGVQAQPTPVFAALAPRIAARLHLLKPYSAMMMATCVREDSRAFPDAEQVDVLCELARALSVLPSQEQALFGRALVEQAELLDRPERQTAALTAIGIGAWQVEPAQERAGLLKAVMHSLMTKPPAVWMDALPALIPQFTRFNLQAELEAQLVWICANAVEAPASDIQRATVLERLACTLGECSLPVRTAIVERIRQATLMLPEALGTPARVTLARIAAAGPSTA